MRTQHLARVFQRGFHHGNQVHGIRFALGIKQLERRKQKRGKRLVEREIIRQIHRGAIFHGAVFTLDFLHHVGIDKRHEHLIGPFV